MPIPKLWSKLEAAGDVTAPQLGTGGALIGTPVFAPSKFNNGIWSDEDGECCTFPTVANFINLDKGTIEFWGKMKFPKTEAAFHVLFDFVLGYSGATGGFWVSFDPNVDDFTVKVYSSGLKVTLTTVGIDFSEEDLLHFAVTWDREGNDIGGGKTVAIYIDNVEKASSTTVWAANPVNANIYVGARQSGGQTEYSDVVIDNIKTYSVCKTDFSDRNQEEFSYSAPITGSDIKWYRSVNWDEGDEHGGDINLSSEIISDELGNIFDDVTDEERTMGTTEYRKIYVFLNKDTVLFNLKLWIDQSALSPDDEISICVEGVTKEDTREDADNYEYISPANFGEAVVLGDLEYLNYFPIWIRRIVSPYAMPWHHSTFKLMVGF